MQVICDAHEPDAYGRRSEDNDRLHCSTLELSNVQMIEPTLYRMRGSMRESEALSHDRLSRRAWGILLCIHDML